MMMTSSGSNISSIQLTDSEDQTENYSVGELYTRKTLLRIINLNFTLQQFYSELYIPTALLRITNTVLSPGNDVTPRMSADWIVHIT